MRDEHIVEQRLGEIKRNDAGAVGREREREASPITHIHGQANRTSRNNTESRRLAHFRLACRAFGRSASSTAPQLGQTHVLLSSDGSGAGRTNASNRRTTRLAAGACTAVYRQRAEAHLASNSSSAPMPACLVRRKGRAPVRAAKLAARRDTSAALIGVKAISRRSVSRTQPRANRRSASRSVSTHAIGDSPGQCVASPGQSAGRWQFAGLFWRPIDDAKPLQ